jgi:hypothetical protein
MCLEPIHKETEMSDNIDPNRGQFGASKKPQTSTDEYGWVIERGDSSPASPLYWAGPSPNDFSGRWSQDHLDAIRFARKRDAENVMAHFDHLHCRACDHIWTGSRNDDGGDGQ